MEARTVNSVTWMHKTQENITARNEHYEMRRLLTCFTMASLSIFWNLRSRTNPAMTSDGTTSRSRKKSDRSRAMSVNEFWRDIYV